MSELERTRMIQSCLMRNWKRVQLRMDCVLGHAGLNCLLIRMRARIWSCELTEKRMMRGDEMIGSCLIPFDKLEEEHALSDHPTGKLKLNAELIPLQGHLEAEPRDAGYLTINVISAKNLLPVDEGDTSDPFIVLKINDNQVGKTGEIRKTLNPTWNKTFKVPVFRNKRASLQIEVRDWNRIQASKTIGSLFFDLRTLQANGESKSFDLPLETVSQGSVQFELIYQLDEVLMQKMREETRNILMAGLHGVGDLGAGVAGGVVGGVGAVGRGPWRLDRELVWVLERGLEWLGLGLVRLQRCWIRIGNSGFWFGGWIW